jgi:CheY-like chemotaxis protein
MRPLKTIFFLDDDFLNNTLNEYLFQNLYPGVRVIIKNDGYEALEYFYMLKKEEGDLPDLLLLDLYMPGMDGFEFLESLRKIDIAIPCIVLSSSLRIKDKVKAKELGVMDYVEKPIRQEYLSNVIRKLNMFVNS